MMDKTLRAYSINKITKEDNCQHLTVCDYLSKKVRHLVYSFYYPILIDEETNTAVDLVGRVPADSAKDFLSKCILVGGLPTKETIEWEEDIVRVKLESILSFCNNTMTPFSEGELLILADYDMESIIDFVVKRSKQL